MNGPVETPKKGCVPLEEALETTGVGLFSAYVMSVTGFVQFSAMCTVQVMSLIIPAAGCDLGLSGFDKGMLTTSSFIGMTLSSLLFGSFADQYGRRTVMIYCASLSGLLDIVGSFAPNYTFLVITWSLNGFLLGGLFSPVFVYVTEFCPARIRAKSVLLPTCIGCLAAVYMPSLAWVILPLKISIPIYGSFVFSSWRLFIALLVVPTALSTYLLHKLPESPKYTLNIGNEEETISILRKMFAMNHKKSENEFPILSVILDDCDKIGICETSGKGSFLLELVRMLKQQLVKLFSPPLLSYTCLSCGMLCGTVGIVNVLFLWLPEQMKILMGLYLAEPDYRATLCQAMSTGSQAQEDSTDCQLNEDIFIVNIITASAQAVIFTIISFLADMLGRKRIIVTFTTISTFGCLALMFINEFFFKIIVNCFNIVILSATIPVGISIIVDFFPTSLRSTAVSITMLFGRLASSGGSQIYGSLYQHHCEELYWGIFAILASTTLFNILSPSKRKI